MNALGRHLQPTEDPENWRRYIEALGNAQSPDAAALGDLVARFGLTLPVVRLHHEIISQVKRLEPIAADHEKRDKAYAKASEKAARKMADSLAACKTVAAVQEWQLTSGQGGPSTEPLRSAAAEASDACFQILSMKSRWPELFGLPPTSRPLTNEFLPPAVVAAAARAGVQLYPFSSWNQRSET